MKDPFDVFLYPDLKFEVSSDRNIYLDQMIRLFPAEAECLKQYFKDVELAANHFMGQWKLPLGSRGLADVPLRHYLDTRFQDGRLKGILASQWGDYGLPPKFASFGVHAGVVRHYLEGGYYPEVLPPPWWMSSESCSHHWW